MKRAIITGANGFIGTALTKYLSGIGVYVYAIIKDNTCSIASIEGLPNVDIVYCDLSELKKLTEKIVQRDFDVFYHLAWIGTCPELRDDAATQLMNVDFSISALYVSKALGCKKYITPGSPLEYSTETEMINENLRLSPQNMYASAKSAIRLLGGCIAKSINQDMNYVVLSSVYGAGRDDSNVVTYTIKSLLKKEKPILSCLTQRWDYIHVNDVVRALYLIGEKGQAGKFYAVGNGDNRPLHDTIILIRDIIDATLPIGIGEYNLNCSVPLASIIDTTEVFMDTGFKSEISFSTGICEMIEYYKERG